MRDPDRGRVTGWLVLLALPLVLASACAGSQAQQAPPAKPASAGAATLAKTPATVPEGAPVTFLPAATARSLELAAISVTSADRLLQNGAKLAGSAVPLPIDPAGVRDMLLTQAGLSPDVAANLDLASPSGAAVVALGGGGQSGVVLAVAARGPAEAERVIGALGKVVAKRGAVVLVDNGTGGRGWVFRAGNVVVLSDEIEALARGAMLALEARHAAPDDVTAVLYPDAIARAHGTDVKTAVAGALEVLRAAQAAEASKTGGQADEHAFDVMAQMLALLADAETMEIGLSIDPARGLALRARLHPRAGTALANVAKDVRPFVLDRGLLAASAVVPTVVVATSYGPFIQGIMSRQRERLTAPQNKKDKGTPAALAFYDALLAALGGQMSMAFTFAAETPHFSGDVSYPLKDAAAAGKVAAALGKLDRNAAVALWNAQMGPKSNFEWTVKKETVGKLKALHYVLTFKKGTPGDAEAVKKLFGKSLDTYMAVVDTRLVATIGPNAKTRLATLAAGKTGAPPQGTLGEALTASQGRDGFFYLDLASVLSMIGSYAQDPRAALLARGTSAPIPIYGTMGGDGAGKSWSADLTVPPAAFVGAGAVIQKMSGAGAPGGIRQ
jgi:hypothetical protein